MLGLSGLSGLSGLCGRRPWPSGSSGRRAPRVSLMPRQPPAALRRSRSRPPSDRSSCLGAFVPLSPFTTCSAAVTQRDRTAATLAARRWRRAAIGPAHLSSAGTNRDGGNVRYRRAMLAPVLVVSVGLSNLAAVGVGGVDRRTRPRVGITFGLFRGRPAGGRAGVRRAVRGTGGARSANRGSRRRRRRRRCGRSAGPQGAIGRAMGGRLVTP